MLIDEVDLLFDSKNFVCSSPRHSNDMLYTSMNQKLTKNTPFAVNNDTSNLSDLFNLVEKSSLSGWNSDKNKNIGSSEFEKTFNLDDNESSLSIIEADTG